MKKSCRACSCSHCCPARSKIRNNTRLLLRGSVQCAVQPPSTPVIDAAASLARKTASAPISSKALFVQQGEIVEFYGGVHPAGMAPSQVARRLNAPQPPSPKCRDQPPLGLPPTKPPRLFGPNPNLE